MALMVALALAFVWHQGEVDRLLMRLEDSAERNERLRVEVSSLQAEVQALAGHTQVTETATRDLGMMRPGRESIVRLRFSEGPGTDPDFSPFVDEALAGERPE
jgi:cell division protein FtsL